MRYILSKETLWEHLRGGGTGWARQLFSPSAPIPFTSTVPVALSYAAEQIDITEISENDFNFPLFAGDVLLGPSPTSLRRATVAVVNGAVRITPPIEDGPAFVVNMPNMNVALLAVPPSPTAVSAAGCVATGHSRPNAMLCLPHALVLVLFEPETNFAVSIYPPDASTAVRWHRTCLRSALSLAAAGESETMHMGTSVADTPAADGASLVRQLLTAGESPLQQLLVRRSGDLSLPHPVVVNAGSAKDASAARARGGQALWTTYFGVFAGPVLELYSNEHDHTVCMAPLATLAVGPGGNASVALSSCLPSADPERGLAIAVIPRGFSLDTYSRAYPNEVNPLATPETPAPPCEEKLEGIKLIYRRTISPATPDPHVIAAFDRTLVERSDVSMKLYASPTEGPEREEAVTSAQLSLVTAAVRTEGDLVSPGTQMPSAENDGSHGRVPPVIYVSFPGGVAQRRVFLRHIAVFSPAVAPGPQILPYCPLGRSKDMRPVFPAAVFPTDATDATAVRPANAPSDLVCLVKGGAVVGCATVMFTQNAFSLVTWPDLTLPAPANTSSTTTTTDSAEHRDSALDATSDHSAPLLRLLGAPATPGSTPSSLGGRLSGSTSIFALRTATFAIASAAAAAAEAAPASPSFEPDVRFAAPLRLSANDPALAATEVAELWTEFAAQETLIPANSSSCPSPSPSPRPRPSATDAPPASTPPEAPSTPPPELPPLHDPFTEEHPTPDPTTSVLTAVEERVLAVLRSKGFSTPEGSSSGAGMQASILDLASPPPISGQGSAADFDREPSGVDGTIYAVDTLTARPFTLITVLSFTASQRAPADTTTFLALEGTANRIVSVLKRGGAVALADFHRSVHTGRSSPHRAVRHSSSGAQRALQCSGTIDRRPVGAGTIVRWSWTRFWTQLVSSSLSFFSSRASGAPSDTIDLNQYSVQPCPSKERPHVLALLTTIKGNKSYFISCQSEMSYVRWLDALVEAGAQYTPPEPPKCCSPQTPFHAWCVVQTGGQLGLNRREDSADSADRAVTTVSALVYIDGSWVIFRQKPIEDRNDCYDHAFSLAGGAPSVFPAPTPSAPWRIALAQADAVVAFITPNGPIAAAHLLYQIEQAVSAHSSDEVGYDQVKRGPVTPSLFRMRGKKDEEQISSFVRSALHARLISTRAAAARRPRPGTDEATTAPVAVATPQLQSDSSSDGEMDDSRATIAQIESSLIAQISYTGSLWDPLRITVAYCAGMTFGTAANSEAPRALTINGFNLFRIFHGVTRVGSRSFTLDWHFKQASPDRSFLWARCASREACDIMCRSINLTLLKTSSVIPGGGDTYALGMVNLVKLTNQHETDAAAEAANRPSPRKGRRATAVFAALNEDLREIGVPVLSSSDHEMELGSDDSDNDEDDFTMPVYTGFGLRGNRLPAADKASTVLVPAPGAGALTAEATLHVNEGAIELEFTSIDTAADATALAATLSSLLGVSAASPAIFVVLEKEAGSDLRCVPVVAYDPSAQANKKWRIRSLKVILGISAVSVDLMAGSRADSIRATANATSDEAAVLSFAPCAPSTALPVVNNRLTCGNLLPPLDASTSPVLASAGITNLLSGDTTWSNLHAPLAIVVPHANAEFAHTALIAAQNTAAAFVAVEAEASFTPGVAYRVSKTAEMVPDLRLATVPLFTELGISEIELAKQSEGLHVPKRAPQQQQTMVVSPALTLSPTSIQPSTPGLGAGSIRLSGSFDGTPTPLSAGLTAPPLSMLTNDFMNSSNMQQPRSPLSRSATYAAIFDADAEDGAAELAINAIVEPLVRIPTFPAARAVVDGTDEPPAHNTKNCPACSSAAVILSMESSSSFTDDPFWSVDSRTSVVAVQKHVLRVPALFRKRNAATIRSANSGSDTLTAITAATRAPSEGSPRITRTPTDSCTPRTDTTDSGPLHPLAAVLSEDSRSAGTCRRGWAPVGVQFRAAPTQGVQPVIRVSCRGHVREYPLGSYDIQREEGLLVLTPRSQELDEVVLMLPADAVQRFGIAIHNLQHPTRPTGADSGWLLKMGGSRGGVRNWKRRWFDIKDGVLTYADRPNGDPLGTMTLWRAVAGLAEDGSEITRPPRGSSEVFVVSDASGRSLYMAATDRRQAEGWIVCLTMASGFGFDCGALLWCEAPNTMTTSAANDIIDIDTVVCAAD